jgi:hypothetical protein
MKSAIDRYLASKEYLPSKTEFVGRLIEEVLVTRGFLRVEDTEWYEPVSTVEVPVELVGMPGLSVAPVAPAPAQLPPITPVTPEAVPDWDGWLAEITAGHLEEVADLVSQVVTVMRKQWDRMYELLDSVPFPLASVAATIASRGILKRMKRGVRERRLKGLRGTRAMQQFALEGMRAMLAAWLTWEEDDESGGEGGGENGTSETSDKNR